MRDHGVGVRPRPVRQLDLDRVRTGVEPDQECLVVSPVRVVVGEVHAERASRAVAPLMLGHFGIDATEPRDVLTA